jgi:four helix bundle protein
MGSFRDLIVYRKAFDLAMSVYDITKTFPAEEKYSLISQIRRSSRSVCSNLAEGYRKRQYPAHFVAKISDADMENTETSVWLDFALACKYIDDNTFAFLKNTTIEIG